MMIEPRLRPGRPWAGIVAIVLRGESFLLTLRAKPPGAGQWGLPGGALRLGETAFAGAIREVREETGVGCEPRASFTTVDVITPAEDGDPAYHFLLAAIYAEWRAGEPVPADDAVDARWFTLEEVASVPHFPRTAELVQAAMRQRDFLKGS